ncbi:MAG TPA: decaprenyl-phosphate phosphoribosyltransferase [Acidimicrobiales bacterium]|nr:decaprenyl-phosphate phosphoribosyltransferase [Acidimicrobiales bacterium]
MVHATPSPDRPATDPPPPAVVAASRDTTGLGPALVRLARPRQWIKNLLVVAAPGAAGVLSHGAPAAHVVGAFVAFCLASSGTYFLNDVLDAEADRHHPTKRLRPVAAGVVPPRLALAVAAALMAGGLGVSWATAAGRLTGVTGAYLVLSVAYSARLKHEPVLDLAGLSGGFILRALAGGIATGVPLSDWFLIVTSFGSLLVATGKRSAELAELSTADGRQRPVLTAYSASFLRSVRLLAAAVTITAYCLWAFERSAAVGHGHPIWFELSIVPVVVAVLQLELAFDRGLGAAPEELALRDRTLQVLGLLWVVLFAVGVYG